MLLGLLPTVTPIDYIDCTTNRIDGAVFWTCFILQTNEKHAEKLVSQNDDAHVNIQFLSIRNQPIYLRTLSQSSPHYANCKLNSRHLFKTTPQKLVWTHLPYIKYRLSIVYDSHMRKHIVLFVKSIFEIISHSCE